MPSLAPTTQATPINLSGLWIPLVTPFHDGAVDHNALHTLTARMKLAGVTGFCGMAKVLAVMPWNRTAKA